MTTQRVRLTADAHGRITAWPEGGAALEDVTPVRCFPLGQPEGLVSFVDGRGRERLFLERLDGLDAGSRALLDSELSRREFVPRITRVVEVRPRTEPSTWAVETDRGPARFVLASEDGLRRIGPDEVLITDAAGVRWRLSGLSRMDGGTRAILRRYL